MKLVYSKFISLDVIDADHYRLFTLTLTLKSLFFDQSVKKCPFIQQQQENLIITPIIVYTIDLEANIFAIKDSFHYW